LLEFRSASSENIGGEKEKEEERRRRRRRRIPVEYKSADRYVGRPNNAYGLM